MHASGVRVAGSSLLVLSLLACQTAEFGATVVTGSADPARDVGAVQAAVDAGGRVALRGTFDFGDRGRVLIRRDVEITGVDGATIRGGFFSLYSPVPETLPPAAPGPRIAIRNLRFDGALWAPVNIGHASALVVSGNRIGGVRPHPLPLPGVTDAQTMAGVLYGMAWAQGLSNRRYVPGVFTGPVRIENNVVELQPPRPEATLGYGIYGQWSEGADTLIAGNRVSGASRTAFEAIDHYRGPDGSGRIVVRGNELATASAGLPFPGRQTPNGVLVGYFSDRKAGTDPARAVPIEIEGNRIEGRGPVSMGVAVLADGAVVKGNTVTTGGTTSLALMVSGSGVQVVGNTLRGSGAAALLFNPFDVFAASRNRVQGNDFGGFRAERGQVALNKGTADNGCSGNAGLARVVDEGERNACR